jgi:hypothetical protein
MISKRSLHAPAVTILVRLYAGTAAGLGLALLGLMGGFALMMIFDTTLG